jgi:hypothetical protein
MNIEDYMHPITDAARIIKASLPPGHGLELSDLVNIGVERVLRYMSGSEGASSVLVFVCAKQGMQHESRRWSGKDRHGRVGDKARKSKAPEFDEYEEWRHCVPTPPIEMMIDLKRALLALPLRESVSWYSQRWLGEEHAHLEPEFGVSAHRIRQYVASANDALKRAAE